MSGLLRSGLGLTGALMLLHAGYSAFESLTYEKALDPSSQLEIPLDVRNESAILTLEIRLETVLSVVLLCLAVVLGAAELKPAKWREWTNQQERENPGYISVNT
jgi:hypothetical protein